ncbi:HAD family hydrolase [Clostridium sp. CM028]|uniref:HAD family hydrolase n=1 Tax=unclassified Clostridium TaxID=2614128 RepID=UPI001C0E664C|nr:MULTISPECIES: HAD family hydrolase [unclassified Clostridium]MBU3093330.1 HAD family hydrolase [Clostridium sp. CF011]MBW9147269.1 HAD family hydrolase [Clostridium sp. CM027]MBW9150441.1 HAD family hydrolase [Clostridium sp. CM028]UVE41786.1 HAD family hydrolase [Clostridium sp. CM027]WAG70786.1 HAD family hydrolase [Clostridium sp. CF011]
MVKLIATDMDGTLLNDNGNINEKIFDLIHMFNEKDIKFAAASGRFYSQLSKNFEKVNTDMIFIAHNGALVKYNNKGKTLYSSSIDREEIDSVVNLNPKLGEELFLAGENEAYIVNPSEDMLNNFTSFEVPVVILKSFSEIKNPIYKITYYMTDGVKPSIVDYIKGNLSDKLEFVVSGDKWIDIMNKGISKGKAINMIQEKFKINQKNTMVFGDYYNDLTMFKAAHYSYAMKNAPEDVKKHANFIAGSNNEDGVYNVIASL